MFKSNFDTIFCPPVNSSGDVYHIASYLILCRTLNHEVPQVVLFCDTDNTEKQAQRSKSFLKALGFIQVRVERYEKTSAQPPVRLAKSAALVKKFSDYAVDQKVTTSLISYAHLVHGKFIHDAIAQHILKLSFKSKAIAAYRWATSQVDAAIKALDINDERFVILNLRYSKNANEEQNLTEQQLKTISKTLARNHCRLIIIDVGGVQGRSFIAKHNGGEYAVSMSIDAFPTIEELDKNYEKFPHILLLQQLARLSTCMGVIGNTSGTLDIAAFMGIKTLCVHRFKSQSSRNVIVPHQDLRVLLQANMMSVFDYAAGLKALERIIGTWLSAQQHILYHLLSQAEKVSLEANKFRLQHYDRSCFALDANDNEANPVFKAQHLQLSCDQKLSDSLVKRIDSENHAAPLTFAFSKTRYAKDDIYSKQIRRTARSKSAPPKEHAINKMITLKLT